jgi:hypothetical protein
MSEIPFAYEKIAATTWAYLSSLLMLALFFKFNRFWSVRNLDLLLIVLLAPGILLIDHGQKIQSRPSEEVGVAIDTGQQTSNTQLDARAAEDPNRQSETSSTEPRQRNLYYQYFGFCWLLSVCLVFLIRLLVDPLLIRRPLLDPNLTTGGLILLTCSMVTFLIANIVTAKLSPEDLEGARTAIKIVQREAAQETDTRELQKRGPGFPLFHLFPIIPTFSSGNELLKTDADLDANESRYAAAAKSLAIISQVSIVFALIWIGYVHLNNFRTGIGIAMIYLLLPYTAQFTGHVWHVLPGALLIIAILCVRRPLLAGIFVGLATGASYYPLFLLPLWISFYWERGAKRFVTGVISAILVCVLMLVLTSTSVGHFFVQLQATFGFWKPLSDGLEGIWGLGWEQWYRLPILVAFAALCVSFVFWPVHKNLGTLISYTAAIMVAVQFWHGFGGGTYMAWFLPAALVTIFRPNMDGRVAKVEVRVDVRQTKEEGIADLIPAA